MNPIKRIKLFVNHNEKSEEVSKKVKESLEKNDFQLVEDDSFDLGIAIGGDGAFLRMVKNASFKTNAFFVGINAGTLGFAQEIHVEEIDSFIEALKKEDFFYEEVGYGKGLIKTKEKEIEYSFLNEIAIRDQKLNVSGFTILIDDVLLEEFAGDGLLIATSFGSTAYNLSFGGSIVYNTFHSLQITPIAPIHNKVYRSLRNSLILPSDKTIKLIPTKSNHLILVVDGEYHELENIEEIELSMKETIKVIRQASYNFITKINDKFLK